MSNNTEDPLVSVITPVYNGELYLAQCIESVLAQTYQNWKYLIINNCSTDGTLEIAEKYAKSDKRISVFSNDTLLDIISNHNKAFRLISSRSKYCKVVSADDLLFPECITRMVSLAEANPTVGIVGSYQVSGTGKSRENWRMNYTTMPYPSVVSRGRDICRSHLLGQPYVFGNPTCVLYRSDLVRRQENFFPNSSNEADASACYVCLRDTDFGFVHQVLSYERQHEIRQTVKSAKLNAYIPSRLSDLVEYGNYYLSEDEVKKRFNELIEEYYEFLAVCTLTLKDRGFWKYHTARLRTLGYPLSVFKLAAAVGDLVLDLALNPKLTVQRILDHRRPRVFR